MNKKNCKEGLDIYKKFITRMDRVSDFLKVAEDVGFDKDDIPDLSKVTRPQLLFICLPCVLNLMIKRAKCGGGESYVTISFCVCDYRIYSCISRPFTTKKSAQKIALDLYTSRTHRPDKAVQEINITIV